MEYSILGKTGRKVSRLGFGGATAGIRNYVNAFDPQNKQDRDKIIAAIHKALQSGITYFDTAPGYGEGASELIFGEALREVNPREIFLATKCEVTDAEGVKKSFAKSLQRLQRDYVDLLQIHCTVIGEEDIQIILADNGMLNAMLELKAEGLVKHIGFSGEAQNPSFYKLLQNEAFDTVQVAYNLIFQHPYDPSWKAGSLYEAEAAGLGIVGMRTVTSGIFQKWIEKVNPENTFDYTPALLQFQLSNPLIDVALVGMRSEAEVEKNMAIVNDKTGRIDIEALHNRKV